ncbi:hypothetical protein CAEBREN_10056 [Caenorhabditis brenneri]|uniref:Uncharacterized protein n=1 Tax=Caenorhabditis brenneri TaxID=135651 RepID=G0NV60_CAEBE|nr:hypothetical protein CAEBREN_10056 [Caenorhabditis brenneri]
MTVSKFVIC